MFGRNKTSIGFAVVTALATLASGGRRVAAEPPGCYAGRPTVLPSGVYYGTAYTTDTQRIAYSDGPGYATYRRTYAAPGGGYAGGRVVYRTRPASVERVVDMGSGCYSPAYSTVLDAGPVVYAEPTFSARYASPYYYGRHYYPGYRSYYHHYRPSYYHVGPRYGHHVYGHHGYRHGHRRWGFSLGVGRGHHGRHGGFSFHYSR